ncbi:MAG: hypothetical protein JWR80_1597 [Bradyrhizobium sp.]|nr:hypothetical protein [Bradyrhizobium sp.]
MEAGVAAPAPKGTGTSTTDGGMRLPSRSDASCCSLSPGPARPQHRSRPAPGHSGSTPSPPASPPPHAPAWCCGRNRAGLGMARTGCSTPPGPLGPRSRESPSMPRSAQPPPRSRPTTSPNQLPTPALSSGSGSSPAGPRPAQRGSVGAQRSGAEIGPRCARSAQPPTLLPTFPLARSFRLCSHCQDPAPPWHGGRTATQTLVRMATAGVWKDRPVCRTRNDQYGVRGTARRAGHLQRSRGAHRNFRTEHGELDLVMEVRGVGVPTSSSNAKI